MDNSSIVLHILLSLSQSFSEIVFHCGVVDSGEVISSSVGVVSLSIGESLEPANFLVVETVLSVAGSQLPFV